MARYEQYPAIDDHLLVQKMRRAIENLLNQQMEAEDISNYLFGQAIDHCSAHGFDLPLGQINRFLEENKLPEFDGNCDVYIIKL